MRDFAYGQTGEKTKSVRRLIEAVAAFGNDPGADIDSAEILLDVIQADFSDIDDVFVDSARTLLTMVVSDRKLDDSERALLKGLATVLDDPVSDEPIPAIDGLAFVLTGDFDVDGGKDTAKEMILAAGGTIKSGVSKKTNYVVAGARGSQAWGYGNFGSKIKKALDLQLTGKAEVRIVSEISLMRSLNENSIDAKELLDERSARFQQKWDSPRVAARTLDGLTPGQQEAYDLVKQGSNVYLSGLGGTGKSFVIRRIIDDATKADKNVLVCAPTGIAALNIGGSTIHRTFQIQPEKTLEIDSTPYIPRKSPLLECDLMIIDEISVCRMDLFDYLSKVLQKVAGFRAASGRKPCQLVVVGDFCQLPPVTKAAELQILSKKYGFDVGGAYPFMGDEWPVWDFIHVELEESIRQSESDFVAALNACRVGDLKGVRWIEAHSASEPTERAITLCGTNQQANDENKLRLDQLPASMTTYECRESGEVTDKDRPTAKKLKLKPGARVMALVNEADTTYLNGSLGTVVACEDRGVVVDFDETGEQFVCAHRWAITEPELVDGKVTTKTIGTFTQIPLKLAWAITIHKAQGQTFEAASIYPRCWDYGQLYTALSRLTKVETLHLKHGISDGFLQTSPDVLSFLEGKYQQPERLTPTR